MADEKTPPKPDEESPYKPEKRPPRAVLAQKLVNEFGTVEKALEAVAGERWNDREKRRVAEKERDDLKAKVADGPKDGDVVLRGEDAKSWNAYKALGLAPDAVKTLQTEHATFKQKDAERAAGEVMAEAAGLAEFTKPGVLARLAKAEGFRVEVRDEGTGENKARVAYAVTGEGDAAKAEPLGDYVAANFADFVPALTATEHGAGTGNGKPSTNTSNGNGAGTGNPLAPRHPVQAPRGQAPAPKGAKDVETLKKEKRATGAYSV